jgi:hypothetical protein
MSLTVRTSRFERRPRRPVKLENPADTMSTSIAVADSPPTRPRKFKGWLVFAAVIVIPLLYILSAGPALMLAQRRIVQTEKIEAYLAPVEFVITMVPGANMILGPYMLWWESLTPLPPN